MQHTVQHGTLQRDVQLVTHIHDLKPKQQTYMTCTTGSDFCLFNFIVPRLRRLKFTVLLSKTVLAILSAMGSSLSRVQKCTVYV